MDIGEKGGGVLLREFISQPCCYAGKKNEFLNIPEYEILLYMTKVEFNQIVDDFPSTIVYFSPSYSYVYLSILCLPTLSHPPR